MTTLVEAALLPYGLSVRATHIKHTQQEDTMPKKNNNFISRLHFLAYIYIHLSRYPSLPHLGKSGGKPAELTGSMGPVPAPAGTDAKV